MPRVPTVTGPSVAEQPLTGGFDHSNPQPIQNRQLAEAGRAMFEIGSQIQEREDADAVLRAETDIKGRYLEWEAEAKQRRGQAAWGISKDAGRWWDEQISKVATGLGNPGQQRLFRRMAEPLKVQSLGVFAGFEAGERRRSMTESTQASLAGSINLAAANPQNAEVLQAAKADVIKRTDLLANVNGWDGTITEAKQTEYLTHFHKQVLQALVRDNPAAAQAYFEANKGEIEGTQHAEVGEFARKATATKRAEDAADAVWQSAGPKSDREPVQLDKLEAQLRAQFKADPETAKLAIAGLRERAAAFKDARRERDDQLEAGVNQAILDGATPRQIRRMPAFLQLSPESARKIMTFLENKEHTAMQRGNAALQRDELEAARDQRRLQREGMGAYLVYSDPDVLAKMTEAQVLNLLPSIGTQLTKQLMNKKREITASPLQLAQAQIDKEDFNHVAQEMGLNPYGQRKSGPARAQLGEVRYRMEQLVMAAQQGGKKLLTRDEKLALLRQELARKVRVDGWLSNKEVPVVGLRFDQIKDVVVPEQDRRQLVDAMRTMYQRTQDRRYAPTEENLKLLYLKAKSPAASLISQVEIEREPKEPGPGMRISDAIYEVYSSLGEND